MWLISWSKSKHVVRNFIKSKDSFLKIPPLPVGAVPDIVIRVRPFLSSCVSLFVGKSVSFCSPGLERVRKEPIFVLKILRFVYG